MLQIINQLRLSRTDSDEISVIEAKQGDNQGDICQIEIYDNQDIVDLSQFDDILFTANKPDMSSVLFRLSDGKNLIKNNNTLSLTFTNALLSIHGTVECELSFYKNDIVKSTYNFNIYVFKSPGSFDVMNESDVKTIKDAVSNVTSSTLKIQEAEKNAKESEENAKKFAEIASESATISSSKAIDSARSAENAKKSETNSKNSENASVKSEENAHLYANQASASKDAAKISETNAKNSETNAANSEKKAINKATEASNSATLAKSYAVGGTSTRTNEDTDNAKYYKEQTSISEKNSSTSATNAKESEKNALSSANTATDKASQAATSEKNAANSANSASTSATTASTKATEASNSAKSAATSATNASNSATSAKNYADSWKGSLLPQGAIAFSQLPTSGMIKGYMYCITDFFNTDSRFEEGSNYFYPANTCVYWTANNQWKCLSGVLSRELTQAEYDALSTEEKNNGTIYYISDGDNLMKVASSSLDGLMSANDKKKLDSIETGANKTTIDSALSSTSTNPVQNKVVNTALNNKANSSHKHTKSEITDFPTSMAANGGNSTTVNGHTVNSDVPANAKFTDTTYSDATTSTHGLMSVADKKKLDGIVAGANVKFISLTQSDYNNLATKESNVIYFITDAN